MTNVISFENIVIPLDFEETFGAKLREIRVSNGMRQSDLASKIGVTNTCISNYERGRLPNIKILHSIARVFNVSIDELVSDSINERNDMNHLNIFLDELAIMPERAHDLDAGIDLFTPVQFIVPSHGYSFVDTGVHIELPHGTCGHVRSKSGLNKKHGITVDGTIDEGYTGSIGVILHNSSDKDMTFERGDKVAQLVIEVILRPVPTLVDSIHGGDRGDGGFGSTGR